MENLSFRKQVFPANKNLDGDFPASANTDHHWCCGRFRLLQFTSRYAGQSPRVRLKAERCHGTPFTRFFIPNGQLIPSRLWLQISNSTQILAHGFTECLSWYSPKCAGNKPRVWWLPYTVYQWHLQHQFFLSEGIDIVCAQPKWIWFSWKWFNLKSNHTTRSAFSRWHVHHPFVSAGVPKCC